MTALSVLQTAAAWLSLPSISAGAFTATDPQVIQLRSLLNEDLADLRTHGDQLWRKLIKEHTFVATATEVQPVTAFPDDLEYIIPATSWDRTAARPVMGPMTPQTWEAWKARPILTSVVFGFRLRGNDFLTAPTPPAGDTIAYEYISNLAVYSDPVTATVPDQEEFDADANTSIFPDVILSRGIRWRFLKAKGLVWDPDFQQWAAMVQRHAARNKGMPVLNTAGNWLSENVGGPYVPAYSFPGP